MKTNPVGYVSGQPGSGKTHAAIEMMRIHLLENRPGAIFYCAPNHKLIDQTLSSLKAVLNDSHVAQRVVHVVSRLSTRHRARSMHDEGRVVSAKEQLSAIMNGSLHGRVVALTHAAFMLIKGHPSLGQITLLFDESRQWVTLRDGVALDDSTRSLVSRLFDTSPMLDNRTGKPVKCNVKLLKPKILSDEKLREIFNRSSSDQRKKVAAIYNRLLPDADGVTRTISYCLLRSTAPGIKSLFAFTMPHHAFGGYKRVIILCANFENSQMFHLLRRWSIPCVNITERFMHGFLGVDRYQERMDQINRRYRKVILSYLVDTQAMPSAHMFDEGILVTEGSGQDYEQYLRDRRSNKNTDDRVASELVASPYAETPNVYYWMEKQAAKLARRWQRKVGSTSNPIIFYNHNRSRDESHDKLFDYVNHGNMIGSNHYQDRNVVAFLMSTNPHPDERIILDILLGVTGYDSDKDYTITKAIQCIGRANVRNVKSSEHMLAILPTRGLAEKIWEQLSQLPILPPYVPEGVQRVDHVHPIRANGSLPGPRSSSQIKGLTEEQAKRLKSLRAMRSQSKHNPKRVAELNEQIELLIKKGNSP